MNPPDNPRIEQEAALHGARWNTVHGGYFSDPAAAATLAALAVERARRSRPEVVVDLGGGTGFLLSQLTAAGLDADIARIVLDDSPAQLNAAREAGFAVRRGSVDTFCRGDLIPDGSRGLYVMRSVLHYAGRRGLRRVLRHIRRQTRPGEFFVHQTAAFRRKTDADCLNELYRMMRTDKWYPDTAGLMRALRAEGWRVEEVRPAPPLRLDSAELMERYHLQAGDIRRIRERLSRTPGIPADVFEAVPDGFRAYLHYWTWACTPASGRPAPPPDTP